MIYTVIRNKPCQSHYCIADSGGCAVWPPQSLRLLFPGVALGYHIHRGTSILGHGGKHFDLVCLLHGEL